MKAVNREANTIVFLQPDCKLWACKPCAARRRAYWVASVGFGSSVLSDAGQELYFVTLTSTEYNRELMQGIVAWRKAWKKLSARFRRASPGCQYCYVGEGKPTGNFHVHMVTTATLPEKWYKDNGAETGLGYIAYAKPARSGAYCGAYIGKYLSKAIAVGSWPKYWRRINLSRKFPKLPIPKSKLQWEMIGLDVAEFERQLKVYTKGGWEVTNKVVAPDDLQSLTIAISGLEALA